MTTTKMTKPEYGKESAHYAKDGPREQVRAEMERIATWAKAHPEINYADDLLDEAREWLNENEAEAEARSSGEMHVENHEKD